MTMDAADLARWTRFAAKGGIGKCTAIQDCIAESPEDLMFLKDDEITVLMQLSNHVDRYLGYCEGVVGRFQGAHVRFHGKLKRPVMTKRSSSAATSPSPSTSASPSPRPSFANLPPRDASPLRQSTLPNGSPATNGSNGNRSRRTSSRATDRDTEIITDPFDLERLASRIVAPRNRKKSRSRSRERDLNGVEEPGTALNADSNERAEEKERREKASAEEALVSDARSASASSSALPTGTPPSTSLPSEGASPSSPHRYSPVTPPPRTVSKPKVPLENESRIVQTLPSPPNSPPKFRKSEDGGASDGESSIKSGRRRTRNAVGGGDMPGLELFVSRNNSGGGSRSESADEDGALAPSRASSQDNEKSSRRRTRILGIGDLSVLGKQLSDSPPPSPLPPSSPMNIASHANSPSTPSYPNSATSNEPATRNQRAPQARKKSSDDEEKSRKRRTGVVGDWTLAVNAQGDVVASPSPLKSEFTLSKSNEAVPEPPQEPAPKAPSPEPDVIGPEGATPAAQPYNNSSTQESDTSREQEPEVSSLYDRGSVYSTSTNSHGLYGDESMSSISGLNVDSSRFAASEDGGLGLGIGLTMLQDMAEAESGTESSSDYGDDSDGKDLTEKFGGGVNTMGSRPERELTADDTQVPLTPRPIVPTENTHGISSGSSSSKPQVGAVAADDAHEDAEEEEGRDWDDEEFYGEDFYDNYRYSRYSVMSKISKRKSQFSVMTAREPESPQSMAFNAVPPIPAVRERKDSGSSSLRSYPSPNEKDKKGKHVPPPLNLIPSTSTPTVLLSPTTLNPSSTPTVNSSSSSGNQKSGTTQSNQISPLLHTNFPSPEESSSRATSFGTPLLSPVPSVSSFSSRSGVSPGNTAAGSGAASALRQKLENEKALSPVPSPVPGANPRPDEGLGNGIVVEDDDEIHVEVVSADQSRADDTIVVDQSRASIDSLTSASVESSVPSIASTSTDLTREMHKIEADIAAVLQNSSVNTSTSSLPADGDPRTPTASEYAMGPTQPLRLQERTAQRPGPLLEQGKSQPQQPPPQQLPPAHSQTVQMPTPIPRPQPRPLLTPEQAIFRPHPNAPPPNPALVSGQRTSTYGMPPVHTEHPVQVNSQQNSLLQTMRLAAAGRMGPNGVPRNTTIYGKTVIDLANSLGPVAMVWSIDPFPLEPSRMNSPGPGRGMPRRSATAGASPLSMSVSIPPPSTPTPPPEVRATPSPPQMVRAARSPSQSPIPPSPGIDGENRGSRVLPRANFIPQVGTARPRSRSFSGLASEPPVGSLRERSSDDVARPVRSASYQSLKQANTSSRPGSHAPSPLSLPRNNTVSNSPRSPGFIAPPSPLGRPPLSPVHRAPPTEEAPQNAGKTNKMNVLRKVASAINVRPDRVPSPAENHPPAAQPQPRRSNSVQAENPPGSSPPSGSASMLDKIRRISSTSGSKKHQRTVSQQSRSSSSSDGPRSNMASPSLTRETSGSTMRRSSSLKAKLSLSHMRIKKDTVPESQVISPTTAPTTPVFEFDEKPETVHVQDAEFEMITPVIMRNSSEANSSGSTRDERPSIQSDFRSDSPATMSSRSVGASRSPLSNGKSDSPSDGPQAAKPAEDAVSIEAHRTRELKWISAMSSIPANQARKNKKIRKLVIEGVPASVRYLVWAHLTDSKGKRIPGVYGQLGKRGKVAATEAIERDAQSCFPDQAHLRDPKGPLVSLLQAYLTMVPDIEYQTSLAIIAGHILLQSPEEDAFWTFVSMMDLHLRSYFSPKSVQMEADATVFQKLVESGHPALAQKLFADLGIRAVEICRPWFTSVFVANLPSDHINRVWDVYLCEGPSFLFRLGLAILTFCRTAIESTRDRNAVLSILARPETRSLLPSNPDDLIESALALKVKDDDIKKQRIKVEAQLKRQNQLTQRAAPMLTSHISLPRS